MKKIKEEISQLKKEEEGEKWWFIYEPHMIKEYERRD